jgi:AcrR family transcriptional regulator
MGRPPKFSREQIQRVALQILDEDGLEHLTMRNVAALLDTGPMTLYGHVRDRADLEVLVVDAIFEELELPPPAESWARSVEDICVASWAGIRRHSHATNLILARRGQSQAALAIGEAIASNLRRGGLEGVELVVTFRAILATIFGGVGADPIAPEMRGNSERFDRDFREHIEQDPTAYPGLATMLPVAAELSPEDIFRGTVRLAINGIEHQAH